MSKTYRKEPLRGNGKAIKFANGGELLNVVFPEADLQKMRTFQSKAGDRFYSFTIAAKRETDDYGNTHWMYVSIEDDGSMAGTTPTPTTPAEAPKGYNPPPADDFPF
jgi:hypothetical protein